MRTTRTEYRFKCIECGCVVNNIQVYDGLCPCCTNDIWTLLCDMYVQMEVPLEYIHIDLNILKGELNAEC
jgi:hypothetical protein